MGRAPCCDKTSVKKGPWSPEEDATLKAYIEQHGVGGNWIALPQKVGLKRCGKSCRLRWLNYLRPDIRHGGFSEEEDQIICNLYISIGSRWSIIAAQLPGRTDNDIKNYWNTRLKKKLLGSSRRRDASKSGSGLVLNQESASEHNGSDHDSSSQNLSATAIERMQLHLQLQGLPNPFSYYNNNPALWPNFYSLASSRLVQGQQPSDACADISPLHQEHESVALKTRYQNSWNPIESDTMRFPSMGTKNMQEELFESSNINSVADGLHVNNLQLSELDCFQEMDSGKKVNMSLWATNGFDENSSSSTSWDSASALLPDSLLPEYMLGYNP